MAENGYDANERNTFAINSLSNVTVNYLRETAASLNLGFRPPNEIFAPAQVPPLDEKTRNLLSNGTQNVDFSFNSRNWFDTIYQRLTYHVVNPFVTSF